MKTLSILLLSVFFGFSLSASVDNGAMAPEFTLQTPDGKTVSLGDFKGKHVVLEWVNPGCPFVRKFYSVGAMQKFQKQAKAMDVVWLTINSTKESHGDYMSPDVSTTWAKEKGVESTWLMDSDGAVGKAYGARTTPHMFIINPEGQVVYQGAIDSIKSADSGDVSKATNYVMENLAALASGGSVVEAQTRPYGCSVKY